MRVKLPLLMAALVWMFSVPVMSAAEGFSDLYVGAAFSKDETITIAGPNGNVSDTIDFEEAYGAGYRLGYWFERASWLGFSLEASYFKHDFEGADLMIVPITPLLMLRLPLFRSNKYPTGGLQPYVAVGPGFFFSKIDAGSYDDKQFDIGLDVRAGLKKMFARSFGMFIEYRYTDFSPKFDPPIIDEIDIKTQYAIIGISLTI